MEFLQPGDLSAALELRRARPEATPIAGGTDLMVDINFDRERPDATIDLTRVPELLRVEHGADHSWIGAGVPLRVVLAEMSDRAPGLCMAARTVGSPQIRSRATLGGNLGTASPAGDTLPALVACGARVEVASSERGTREIPVGDFIESPRRSALAPDELITRVAVPHARGPQQYSKIGQRNAMVIAIASFGIAMDVTARTIRTGIGSAGPRILTAPDAEQLVERELSSLGCWDGDVAIPASLLRQFGELVGEAAKPIDDVRGTARYRRHALSVVAARGLKWVWAEHRSTGSKGAG